MANTGIGASRSRRAVQPPALRGRLEARKEEIEAAVLTRVKAISNPTSVSNPAYAEGLRAAVTAAVSYGIETTGREAGDLPIPVALRGQARLAARAGISLDTVLRRYFAGYNLLGYFILEEAQNASLTDGAQLKRLLGNHAGIFDRLLAAVGEEHRQEVEALALVSGERRRVEQVERLLEGEPLNTSRLDYDFDAWHLGVVGIGAGAGDAICQLADLIDCRLLTVHCDEDVTWTWFGGRQRLTPERFLAYASEAMPPGASMAVGDVGQGLPGWRLTHRQAIAALPIALGRAESCVRYRDVILLASAVRDDLLVTSLCRFFLEPLREGRDGGKTLRRTLRAYFAVDRNATSAAASLGVSRQAVNSRLGAVERRLGRSLASCATELEIALQIEDLQGESHRPGTAQSR